MKLSSANIKKFNQLILGLGFIDSSLIKKYFKKLIPHHARGVTLKRETRGGVLLRELAPRQRSSEETSQRWRAAGDRPGN